jgi:hypothetical protein
MPHQRKIGRTLSLSLPRRLVVDLMRLAHKTPTVVVGRSMNLASVVAARTAASPRIGWAALFLKAYGLVAAARPDLRRCYLGWPLPRIYEHYENVASIAVEREYEGENSVFMAVRNHPEQLPLPALEEWIGSLKTMPFADVPSFRRALRLSRLPRPMRRLLLWAAWTTHGRLHAKSIGTFGLTAVGGSGGSLTRVLSPLATTVSYGPVEPDGSVDVILTFDHRVLDGGPAARALGELENALIGPVRAELSALARHAA